MSEKTFYTNMRAGVFVVVAILFGALGASSLHAQTTPGQLLGTLFEIPVCSLNTCTLTEPNLHSVMYSGNGHFVVSGEVTGQGREGVWAFTESGQSSGVGNLWADIGRTSADAHQQAIAPFLQWNGAQGFVHGTKGAAIYGGPPSYYEFSGGRLVHRSQAYSGTYVHPGTGQRPEYRGVQFAVANGHVVVAYEHSSPNSTNGTARETVVYRLPGFTEVDRMPASFVPITGIGDFIVAVDGSLSSADIALYQVESNGDVVFVEDLPRLTPFTARVYDVDYSTNPVQIRFLDRSTNGTRTARLFTYQLAEDGLDYIDTETFQSPADFGFSVIQFRPFAVSGTTAAFSVCNGSNTSTRTCGVAVYENGTYGGLVPSPSFTTASGEEYGRGHAVSGVDLSPSGRMFMVNPFSAQLYDLGVTQSTPTPQMPTPTAPGPGGTPDAATYLNLAQQYLDTILPLFASPRRTTQSTAPTAPINGGTSATGAGVSTGTSASLDARTVQQILNTDPDTRVATAGPGSPGEETSVIGPLTVSALQRFQCKYAIVCSGSPETTGYGNLGPQTQAKLREVSGGGVFYQGSVSTGTNVSATALQDIALQLQNIERAVGTLNAGQ